MYVFNILFKLNIVFLIGIIKQDFHYYIIIWLLKTKINEKRINYRSIVDSLKKLYFPKYFLSTRSNSTSLTRWQQNLATGPRMGRKINLNWSNPLKSPTFSAPSLPRIIVAKKVLQRNSPFYNFQLYSCEVNSDFHLVCKWKVKMVISYTF